MAKKFISDQEMQKIETKPTTSGVSPFLYPLVQAGQAIEKYSDAPFRKGLLEAKRGGLMSGLRAAKEQFGAPTETAPSGEQVLTEYGLTQRVPEDARKQQFELARGNIARQKGLLSAQVPESEVQKQFGMDLSKPGPTAAEVLGKPFEMIASPLNVVGPVMRGVGAAGKAAARVLPTAVTEIGGAAARGVGGAVKSGALKVGTALTGIPEKEIESYVKYADDIDKMSKASHGDVGVAADNVRKQVYSNIMAKKQQLGQKISEALKSASPEKTIDIKDVIEHISSAKSKINPKLYPEKLADFDEILTKINSFTEGGKVSVPELNELKEFLQENAKSSYFKAGQMFGRSKEVANTAKQAAARARKSLNDLAPEIKDANNQLSQLHDIEGKLNKNLIAEGKPESSLVAVGAGGQGRNRAILNRLGKATDQDIVAEAEKLAAMKEFRSPGLLPIDPTGKAVARSGGAALIGGALGGIPGAVVGGLASSPLVTKGLLKTGMAGAKAIQSPLLAPAAKGLIEGTKPLRGQPQAKKKFISDEEMNKLGGK